MTTSAISSRVGPYVFPPQGSRLCRTRGCSYLVRNIRAGPVVVLLHGGLGHGRNLRGQSFGRRIGAGQESCHRDEDPSYGVKQANDDCRDLNIHAFPPAVCSAGVYFGGLLLTSSHPQPCSPKECISDAVGPKNVPARNRLG